MERHYNTQHTKEECNSKIGDIIKQVYNYNPENDILTDAQNQPSINIKDIKVPKNLVYECNKCHKKYKYKHDLKLHEK